MIRSSVPEEPTGETDCSTYVLSQDNKIIYILSTSFDEILYLDYIFVKTKIKPIGSTFSLELSVHSDKNKFKYKIIGKVVVKNSQSLTSKNGSSVSNASLD